MADAQCPDVSRGLRRAVATFAKMIAESVATMVSTSMLAPTQAAVGALLAMASHGAMPQVMPRCLLPKLNARCQIRGGTIAAGLESTNTNASRKVAAGVSRTLVRRGATIAPAAITGLP